MTVFDHRYEFLNGNPGASERLWKEANYRPSDNGLLAGTDVRGMMWHMRPALVEKYDPAADAVSESYWIDVFVTNAGAGLTATGKLDFVAHEPDPNPFLAHFTETHNYINFVDANGNGRLDNGERFKDMNGNGAYDIGEPFEDVVQVGLNGAADRVTRARDNGDGRFFSDLNRNGLEDDGTLGIDPLSVSRKPWAWLKNETFMVNDLGQILDLRAIGQNTGSSDSIAQTFEQVNFERTWQSSEFADKIDVMATPRILLKSGFLKTQVKGNEPVDQR
ncbi:MAG: hypothetical protein A3A86_03430 [Elusimicrobia bacterium RIFCSPLOWO2_01_FULL_60_11]|nr:MAG: hypothetical protein A3A86_03430 [Elusimicrobia bacterium RIFCSPLOWO2_01_FULL_60_11]